MHTSPFSLGGEGIPARQRKDCYEYSFRGRQSQLVSENGAKRLRIKPNRGDGHSESRSALKFQSPIARRLRVWDQSTRKNDSEIALESEGINTCGRQVKLFSNGHNSHHFVNGELDILCDILAFDDHPAETKFESKEIPIANFGSLFEIGHYDVTLVAEDEELQAHKVILSGRSAVFAQKFEHNMQENSSNIVKIEDIEANTLQDMIKFIYTGETPMLTSAIDEWADKAETQSESDQKTADATESEPSAAHAQSESTATLSKEESKLVSPMELANKLLYAADKYTINDLVEVCEETLHQYNIYLNIENAAEVYSANCCKAQRKAA